MVSGVYACEYMYLVTVRSLFAIAWYRCTPAGKVEVMLESSFKLRKGYFLVDMPLRYNVVFELQNTEDLGSLCQCDVDTRANYE